MRVTDHARRRGKERLGLNAKSLQRTALRALVDGLGRPDAHGQIRAYLDAKRGEHPDGELFVYGEFIFVFAGNVLITCLRVPPVLKSGALKQWVRWRDSDGQQSQVSDQESEVSEPTTSRSQLREPAPREVVAISPNGKLQTGTVILSKQPRRMHDDGR